MRPILVILIFFSGTVLSKYHEKRRFDRDVDAFNEASTLQDDNENQAKQWTFIDTETGFVAHKDINENACYLERRREEDRPRSRPKVLYVPAQTLTKLEAWRLAGGRIVDFCKGRTFSLLSRSRPIPGDTQDPFMNELPEDENDIAPRRVRDVVLTPLLTRTKRHILLEEREKLNQAVLKQRNRRQATQFRGRFRGQTQSQYLDTGSDDQKEGRAEAEATQQSSRAVVRNEIIVDRKAAVEGKEINSNNLRKNNVAYVYS